MIFEYFMVIISDESVLHLNKNLKVDLKNGNVQCEHAMGWKTITAVKKQLDEVILES